VVNTCFFGYYHPHLFSDVIVPSINSKPLSSNENGMCKIINPADSTNEDFSNLKHLKYGKLFLRGTKNLFISMCPLLLRARLGLVRFSLQHVFHNCLEFCVFYFNFFSAYSSWLFVNLSDCFRRIHAALILCSPFKEVRLTGSLGSEGQGTIMD